MFRRIAVFAAGVLLLGSVFPGPSLAAWSLTKLDGYGLSTGSDPVVSDDGCYGVYEGSNGGFWTLMMRDCTTDTQVPIAPSGNQAVITPDGKYVAFVTYQSLVPADTNSREDIYRWNRLTGGFDIVSLGHDGSPSDGYSSHPSISADGRYVAYVSSAHNLNGEALAWPFRNVFVRDMEQAVVVNERASAGPGGAEANWDSYGPAISRDGNYVAFRSMATNLTADADTTSNYNIYVRNRWEGVTHRITNANDHCGNPVISGNGRFVAFSSVASDLVPGDGNGLADVFAADLWGGGISMVSVTPAGLPGNGMSGCYDPVFTATRCLGISASGRYVSFPSMATDLVTSDTNGYSDVFLRDRRLGSTRIASLDSFGDQASGSSAGDSGASSMSGNGRFIVFDSDASLAGIHYENDLNAFLLDRATGDGLDLVFPITEDFADETTKQDKDWRVVSGAFRITPDKRYRSNPLLGNLALLKALDVVPAEYGAAAIEARVTLSSSGLNAPNAWIVFGRQDAARFRFVKMAHGKLIIGQKGTLGGEGAGTWVDTSHHYDPGTPYNLTIQLFRDGLVKVYRDGTNLAAEHKFDARVDGAVGLRAVRSRSFFDDIRVWDDGYWR
jgi:Tol biopolymer transport system component